MIPILQCNEVFKSYGRKSALNNINLSISSGKIVGLLGPNGSGKTTLIKLISGLLVPTKGEILINGLKPGVESKKIVSYLPDKNHLYEWMKISELIRFFDDFYSDFDKNKAIEMINRLGININDKFKSLSKGTKEKVSLTLIMSRNAKLYLLDEPIGGVDPAARDYILETIISNYNEDATIIISTHLISDIEKVLDEVILINNGEVVLTSTVDDIREKRGLSVDALFREEYRC